ncbi:MAG: transposase [Armatimonadia bacterium]
MEALLWLQRNRGVLVHAFVVMSTHIHLVLTLPAEQLSGVMHSFKSFTANEINKVLGRVGPLWDEGYHEEALLGDAAVEAATAHVESNPVKARIVKTAQGYEWSSAWPDYRLIVGVSGGHQSSGLEAPPALAISRGWKPLVRRG